MKKEVRNTTIGTLTVTFEGYGFVIPEVRGDPDLFIPAYAMGDALHKDRIEVTSQKGRGDKMEGRIVRILERGLKKLVGRYEIQGKSAIVVTEDFRVARRVVIPAGKDGGARHNEMVIVKVLEYPSGNKPLVGEVIERLGKRGSDNTELKILIARHNLPEDFPEEVVQDAKRAVKKFYEEDLKGRIDLTKLPFITIDGEDAKDFDDAVCAERINSGQIRVWVSIADVSHFVDVGSYLEQEASKRATSVYLPGYCIPMLPEDLSTNICSLLPGENRFCFTAELVVNSDGTVKKSKFYKSLIKSNYRMTYTEANDYLTNHKQIEASKEVLASLELLKTAASFIRKDRVIRGSIDFDLPEPSIVLDLTGKPENIVKAQRNIAHMLIEDLMIAANEAVATFLTRKGYPCMYRIHDRPNSEKLLELMALMKYLGHNVSIGSDPTPKKLAKIVGLVAGRPEERLINMLLLRCMAQAIYGLENVGHFGLASNCYCHFTSPIRRYPDLLIHRLLADAIGVERFNKARSLKYLKDEAVNCSKMERRSMEAERESLNLYTAIFMRDKVGEEFDGIVSHTAKKGIFVELMEYFVEGMIKPEDLIGDKYKFDPKRFAYIGGRKGRSLHIGEKIRVRVKDVIIEERRVYFEPIGNF